MKKSIFLLLFLFLVLVVTCVYQKTYTIYEQAHTENKNTNQTKYIETETRLKKETVVTEKNKGVHVTAITDMPIKSNPPPFVEDADLKKQVFFEKVKKTVIPTIATNKKEVKIVMSPLTKSSATVPSQNENTVDTAVEEKEVVDYLLSVLNEQDIALANRYVAESKLHVLIIQVLKERHTAIATMEKTSLDIDTRHQKRLKERDKKSQNIYEYHTEEGK